MLLLLLLLLLQFPPPLILIDTTFLSLSRHHIVLGCESHSRPRYNYLFHFWTKRIRSCYFHFHISLLVCAIVDLLQYQRCHQQEQLLDVLPSHLTNEHARVKGLNPSFLYASLFQSNTISSSSNALGYIVPLVWYFLLLLLYLNSLEERVLLLFILAASFHVIRWKLWRPTSCFPIFFLERDQQRYYTLLIVTDDRFVGDMILIAARRLVEHNFSLCLHMALRCMAVNCTSNKILGRKSNV